LLSTSFVLILAAVERALAVSDDFYRRAISDPGSDLLWHSTTGGSDPNFIPEPIRGSLGTIITETGNVPYELQNADSLAPPFTDGGSVKNIKWTLATSKYNLFPSGWGRTISYDGDMPAMTEIGGGGIGLKPGGTRVLHWHDATEYGYVLKGECRVTCVTPEGQSWTGDVPVGDLWNFPNSYPHSIQAKNVDTEFFVVFDIAHSSGGTAWHLQDWLARTPKATVAKNFGWTDPKILDKIPTNFIFVYQGVPPPEKLKDDLPQPNNTPVPYTYEWSKQKAHKAPGGTYKVVDKTNFGSVKAFSTIEVTVEPGHMRELHWHPYIAAWVWFIHGEARMTVFGNGPSNARTFNFLPGDVGYVPTSFGHYIENTGNTTLKFLELTKSATWQDISAQQWMALVPKSLVKGHFDWSPEVIDGLKKEKQWVV